MEEELFALKWNNHQSTFLRIIKSLRFKNLHTDATLACDGKFFSVHKFVLSTCSDYFNDIFHQTSCKCPVIVLKDVDRKNLEYLLDYMYIGEINVKQNELASLVSVAECLKIKGLAVPDEDPENSSNSKPTQPSNLEYKDSKEIISNTSSSLNSVHNNKELRHHPSIDLVNDSIKSENEDTLYESKDYNSENTFETSKIKLEPNESFLSLTSAPSSNDGGSNLEVSGIGLGHEQGNSIQEYFSFEEKLINEGVRGFGNIAGPSKNQIEAQNPQWGANGIQNMSGGFSSQILNSESRADKTSLLSSQLFSCKNYGLKRLKRKLSHLKKSKVNYVCPHCSYTCNDKSNFKRHVQIHTGEKPYHCPFCRYSSIHSSNLKTHIRNKHSNDLTDHSQSINFISSSKSHVNVTNDSNSFLSSPIQAPSL